MRSHFKHFFSLNFKQKRFAKKINAKINSRFNNSFLHSHPFHKIFMLSVLCFGGVGFTVGCSDSDRDALSSFINKFDKKTTKTSEGYCHAKTVPFTYTLCQVKQNSLMEPNSPLSLQLFWKSAQNQPKGDSKSTHSKQTAKSIIDKDKTKSPLYNFDGLIESLPKKRELKFAVNGGMYNSEYAPIGYTVINGHQILSLNLNEGVGNFHLLPNGVLWWDKTGKTYITESKTFNKMLEDKVAHPWYATQSGPMLVIDGNIHPKFGPNSTSKKIRNGVGICDDGKIKFVNSNQPVSFYQFASLFKDDLKCPNALFLDGGVASAIYAPDIGLKDNKDMGVMIGLVESNQKASQ